MVLWPWEYFVESVVVLASRHVESSTFEVVDWEVVAVVVVVVAVVMKNVVEVEKVQYFELDTTQNAVWMYCL